MIFILLCGLVALNICDVLVTLQAFSVGGVQEGNILVQYMLNRSIPLAVACKMGIVLSGSAVIWRLRHRPMVFWAVVAVTAWYGVLVFYENVLLARVLSGAAAVAAL